MSRADVLDSYLRRGWALVPVRAGHKAPFEGGWLTTTFSPADFSESDNVGVKNGEPSGGLVDLDCDCREGVLAAADLMPETALTSGRTSRPRSHLWYVVRDGKTVIESRKFLDLDNKQMILEIRSTGTQTVIPPSVHPSGEPYAWDHEGTPLEMTPSEFLAAARMAAIAALCARHWPAAGRHVAAGDLAGFLLRCGLEATFVPRMVESAARIAGDDEPSDRRRMAEDTVKKHAAGGIITGGPKVADSFPNGQALVARIYQWLERKSQGRIDQINETYFVARVGTETMVHHEVPGEALETFDFEEMRRRFYTEYIATGAAGPKSKKVPQSRLGEYWLSSPQRRSHRRVTCAPPPVAAHPDDYNTWKGFTVAPDTRTRPEMRCGRYLDHLRRVICNGNDDYFAYLLDVCAITVQLPGQPSEVAVVLRGDQGVGKGTFINLFGGLFGPHFLQVDKATQVTGRFNDHLSGCVVLYADEAVWGGNKQEVGALRRMVTEGSLSIEAKFQKVVKEKNFIHLFMSTNELWVWPAALKERRGFILDVEQKEWATRTYFAQIQHEWRTGGAAAFLAFCQQREVEGNRLAPIPKTQALVTQMDLSLPPLHQWWVDRLAAGELWPAGGWPEFVTGFDILENYLVIMGNQGKFVARPTEAQLARDFVHLLPEVRPGRRRVQVNIARPGKPEHIENMLRRGWVLPPLTSCRSYYDRLSGVPRAWPLPQSDPTTPDLLPPEESDDAASQVLEP